MKAHIRVFACLLFISVFALPMMVELYIHSSSAAVRVLGGLVGLTGCLLWKCLPRLRAAAVCIYVLLIFQFSNTIVRNYVTMKNRKSAEELDLHAILNSQFVRAALLLALMAAAGIVIPMLMQRYAPVLLGDVCAKRWIAALLMAIYIPLILIKISRGASSTVVSIFGITPLEIAKFLICVQIGILASEQKKDSGMLCTVFFFFNCAVFMLLRETGSFLIFSVCFFITMLSSGFYHLAITGTLLGGGVIGGAFWVCNFLSKLKISNEEIYNKVPGLMRTLSEFYMKRVDLTAAQAGDLNQIGYALSGIARSRLFWGYGSLGSLPEGSTDMAFAGCVECYGLLAGLLILACLTVLMCSLWMNIRERSSHLPTAIGVQTAIATMFTVETIIMVGGNLGILPLTGLPTFFLSKGMTSNVCGIAAVFLFHECICYVDREEEHAEERRIR